MERVRSRTLQSIILAILIFALIALFIIFFIDDFLLQAIFILIAFVVLLRVLYQIVRPPEPEVIKKEGEREIMIGPEPGKDLDLKKEERKGKVGIRVREELIQEEE
jgi:predicted membrane protein